MKLILTLALAVAGLGGGLAAGHLLRAPPEPPDAGPDETGAGDLGGEGARGAPRGVAPPPDDPDATYEYVELDDQFVVPLVDDRRVRGLVILNLSLEVEAGAGEAVFAREPKLRDRFLQVLFLHARSGAFDGAFTGGPAMADLRGSLLETAQGVLGPQVRDVLVTDILRQDL